MDASNAFKLSALAALVMAGSSVHAQSALEEVIVLAQKREQSMMDVPIAVTALTGEQLQAAVVNDIFDLRASIPALEVRAVDPPSQGTAFAIRGLGTSVFNMGFEPTVATFVDGVYRSRSGLLASTDLIDMERIEVLKGPQGTLFGKNTTGGAVTMYTNKPELGETSGYLRASYEEYNRTRLSGVLNLPLSDTAALRLAGGWAQGDGWMDNKATGNEIHDLDRWNVKAQLLFMPNDDLSVRIIADYAELSEACCAPMRFVNDPRSGAVNGAAAAEIGSTIIDPADIGDYNLALNTDPKLDAEDKGISAEINWTLASGLTLTSISAYRSYEDENYKDNDFTGVDVLYSNQDLPEVELFSQELRLAGDSDFGFGPLSYTLGAYYSEESIELNNEFIWGSQALTFFFPWHAPMSRAYLSSFEQETDSFAVFAQGSWDVSDALSLTLGVRYSEDDKEGSLVNDQPLALFMGMPIPNVFPLGVVYDYDAEKEDDEWTWTASAQYDLSDETMVYASYTHGYKSGGISMTRDAGGTFFAFTPVGPAGPFPPTDPTFDKETADSFEVGLKSTLMDGRMRLLAAAWYTEFEDLQVQVLRPEDGAFAVSNAEGAISQGIEFETNIAVTDALTLNASVQYLDATYDNGTGNLSGASVADLDNEDLALASDWTGTVGFNYDRPVGDNIAVFMDANLFFRSDARLSSEIQRYDTDQDGYELLTLRTGVRTLDDQWELSAWCRNCTDESYAVSKFQIPFDGYLLGHSTVWSHVGTPRIMGVTGTWRF